MEKGKILSLMVLSLLISVVSAQLTINEQPKDVYNMGDVLSIPVTINALTNTYGFFQMNLICNGKEMNFYKSWISLAQKSETKITSSVQLVEEMLDGSKGTCKVEVSLLKESSSTNEFIISDSIDVKASLNKNKFNPEEEISIKGNATKESGSQLDGFAEIAISKEESNKLNQIEAITNGEFSSKIKIPKTMEAGNYLVTITAYEKDLENRITNKGSVNYEITISQIPTNLEIVLEQKEVNPGETFRIKAILHDQTGEKIKDMVVISIKDEDNTILEQIEKETDIFVEYKIKEGQLPSEWKIVAVSNQITKEDTFRIKEQSNISLEIINRTIILTNTGNVVYNKTVFVKIGEKQLEINANIDIGESKEYYLTAPNGEYQVEVLSSEGEETKKMVILTGNAISVKEVSENAMELARHMFVWMFIIIVLGFVAFFLFKKISKKSFFGFIPKEKNKSVHSEEKVFSQRSALVSPKNKAHFLPSIQGTQQPSSVVCIKIKNHSEIISNKNNSKETLQKIVEMAENAKASVYENNECIFFLFVPSITKTSQSEITAADLAQSAKKILDDYNRLFKQKIKYGISVEYGEVVAKKTGEAISFMGLGQFMVNARKLASISQEEVCVGEKMKEKIQSSAKLEKHSSERGSYYTIKELRDKEKHKTFLSSFVKRYERDKEKPEESKKEKVEEEKPQEDEDFDLNSI